MGARLCALPRLWALLLCAAVTTADYSQQEALELAQFARASFCSPGSIDAWSCGEPCEAVPRPAAVRALQPGPGSRWQPQGLAARLGGAGEPGAPSGPARCVVAFRGSLTLRNWAADADFPLVAWPGEGEEWCAGCRVHDGFAGAYGELRPVLKSALRELGCEQVVVTGHSLGGAVATLAAAELRASANLSVPLLLTFGSPRVGDHVFAAAFQARADSLGLEAPSWRVVHYHDPVPHLPPLGVPFQPFVHVAREVWYTMSFDSFQVCDASGEDPRCADSTPLLRTIDQGSEHTHYLNLTFEHTELPAECLPGSAQSAVYI